MARKTTTPAPSLAAQVQALDTSALLTWLSNHQACKDAGVNVGQMNLDKAQKISVELIRRGAYPR